MKKLRLDFAALEVQSFETADRPGISSGTVFGREAAVPSGSITVCRTLCACPPTPIAA